jgi:hypothetical protein
VADAVRYEASPVRNTLRGFLAIHRGGLDGRVWVSPPARPMLDANGVAVRDERGKVKYFGITAFATAEVRERWSRAVVNAVVTKHPDALSDKEQRP